MNIDGTTATLRTTTAEEEAAFLDLTERENPYFRYAY